MVAGIWGQTRCSGDRAFDPPGLTEPRSAGRGRLRPPDMGTDTMSDIPIRNVQRPTFNSQLSKGVTERAHGGRDMGTDTEFGRPDSWPGGPGQAPVAWPRPAVVPRYGDRHDVWAVGGANRGTSTIFVSGGRIFDTSELTQRPVGRSNRAAAPTSG